jgi:hypothetical protein
MIIIPSLIKKSIPRPNRPQFEESYLVPDKENNKDFWNQIYAHILSLKLQSPVEQAIKKYINSDFGYFGFRVHPVTRESRYFHAGVSLDLVSGHNIYPVLPGVLEYSGYGAINGYYVLLSHPEIQTQDGYILHSMYCHLKKPLVKFNSYEKMLREISLGSYPLRPINIKTILGVASTTGVSRENKPGIYLQFSFRKFDTTPIVIDPLRAYLKKTYQNTSADIVDQKSIDKILNKKTS